MNTKDLNPGPVDSRRALRRSVPIYDRLEANVEIDAPNYALAGYRAPENYKAESCPLCQAGTPISSF